MPRSAPEDGSSQAAIITDVNSPRRFLILHGWQNRRPRQHWQWQLAEALRADGEQVLYPQLPEPDRPSLAAWTEVLQAELAQLGRGERVVIAHSLSVPLWMSAAGEIDGDQRVSRVLLVAPPGPQFLLPYPEVAEFGRIQPDAAAVRSAAASTRLVYGDDDPYCPGGAAAACAELGLDADLISGGAHLDLDAGYGAWPSMLDWCRDPATRLQAR